MKLNALGGCQSRLLPGNRGQIKGQLRVLKCMSLFERIQRDFLKFKTFFTLGPECFIILCSSKAAQTTLKVNLFRAVIIERIFKTRISNITQSVLRSFKFIS